MFYLFDEKTGIMNYPYVNGAFPLLNTQQKQIAFINFPFIIDFHAVSLPQCDGKMEETVLFRYIAICLWCIILLGYSRKIPNGGLRICNFQSYQRNSMWNFQWFIKNEVEFPVWPRKNNVEFPGIFVFGLGISEGSNTILWNIQGLSFVLSGISRGKEKKIFSGGFSKKHILNPHPCLDFFWNSPLLMSLQKETSKS